MLTTMLLAALATGQQEDPAAAWVKQLGAEAYVDREKATDELRKLGKAAEPALKKALESQDAEVRRRAQSLLEELAAKEKPQPPEQRRGPRFVPPGLQGFKGATVRVQTINGDSTYVITPGEHLPGLTFRKWASGKVELEYRDDQGEKKTVEAATLEAFLKDHAALAEKFGITGAGIAYGGARVSFDGRTAFGGGLPWDFGRRRPKPAASAAAEPVEDFEPLGEVLRSQLNVPEGRGVLVLRDGAAPGLLKHDIVLEIDGHPVSGVAEAKKLSSKGVTFTVLRKGKRETLKVERKDF